MPFMYDESYDQSYESWAHTMSHGHIQCVMDELCMMSHIISHASFYNESWAHTMSHGHTQGVTNELCHSFIASYIISHTSFYNESCMMSKSLRLFDGIHDSL